MQLLKVILLLLGLSTFKLFCLLSFLKLILFSESTVDDIVFFITFFSLRKKLFFAFISVKLDKFYNIFLLIIFLFSFKADKDALILFNLLS